MAASLGWATPVIAGNWKMNKGPQSARLFAAEFSARYAPIDSQTVVVCPPTIAFTSFADAMSGRRDIVLGVQNIHWEKEGAFTGEVNASMAKEAGAQIALIGHSERRHVFGETDEEVQKKVQSALKAGLTPVICVGEKLDERKAGKVDDVILRQLRTAIDGFTSDQAFAFLVAYEPVWAIGTGVTATPEDASAAHATLRRFLKEQLGEDGLAVPILYGGSVKPDNSESLLTAEYVDGLLIGGASLDPEGFARICRRSSDGAV
ncbi:MAG TPA: triose-phosphate isomerase [Longimicrobiales bacterium]|nr:triose-phosphate isomerase [Longimicrobiales bacterium]